MIAHYVLNKVALSIKINDLPDHYRYKHQVIRNEGRWWLEEVEQDIYKADTDTTFSLMKNIGDNMYKSLRIAKSGGMGTDDPYFFFGAFPLPPGR